MIVSKNPLLHQMYLHSCFTWQLYFNIGYIYWYSEGSSSVALIFRVCHHVMISNHQHKYEDTEKVGEETQILIINHLQQRMTILYQHRGFEVNNNIINRLQELLILLLKMCRSSRTRPQQGYWLVLVLTHPPNSTWHA